MAPTKEKTTKPVVRATTKKLPEKKEPVFNTPKKDSHASPHVLGEKYYEAVGRRKTSVARVRLYETTKPACIVNGKDFQEYFTIDELRMAATGAMRKMKVMDNFLTSVMVSGGGIRGQAEAMRLATARALVKYNEEFHQRLKKAGYLRRDARAVERKKFGLKKARRAPQWNKR